MPKYLAYSEWYNIHPSSPESHHNGFPPHSQSMHPPMSLDNMPLDNSTICPYMAPTSQYIVHRQAPPQGTHRHPLQIIEQWSIHLLGSTTSSYQSPTSLPPSHSLAK